MGRATCLSILNYCKQVHHTTKLYFTSPATLNDAMADGRTTLCFFHCRLDYIREVSRFPNYVTILHVVDHFIYIYFVLPTMNNKPWWANTSAPSDRRCVLLFPKALPLSYYVAQLFPFLLVIISKLYDFIELSAGNRDAELWVRFLYIIY